MTVMPNLGMASRPLTTIVGCIHDDESLEGNIYNSGARVISCIHDHQRFRVSYSISSHEPNVPSLFYGCSLSIFYFLFEVKMQERLDY
jgi:hypothetical protein